MKWKNVRSRLNWREIILKGINTRKGGNPQEDTCMGRKMPGKEVIRDGGYVIVFIGYCIYHSRY